MKQMIFLVAGAFGHSWLDCVDLTDTGCNGYVRGYTGHLDDPMTYKILNREDSDPICRPGIQDMPDNYTAKYPRAKARPGQTNFFQYSENGHVTKDIVPPTNLPNPKAYSIHWTGKPYFGKMDDGSQLLTRGDLSNDTQLGPARPFDDGVCAEDKTRGRSGPLPCLGNYTIPIDTPPGIYQFVWWWKFDRDPNAGGEEYTSCFDIEVTDKKGKSIFEPRNATQQRLTNQLPKLNSTRPNQRTKPTPTRVQPPKISFPKLTPQGKPTHREPQRGPASLSGFEAPKYLLHPRPQQNTPKMNPRQPLPEPMDTFIQTPSNHLPQSDPSKPNPFALGRPIQTNSSDPLPPGKPRNPLETTHPLIPNDTSDSDEPSKDKQPTNEPKPDQIHTTEDSEATEPEDKLQSFNEAVQSFMKVRQQAAKDSNNTQLISLSTNEPPPNPDKPMATPYLKDPFPEKDNSSTTPEAEKLNTNQIPPEPNSTEPNSIEPRITEPDSIEPLTTEPNSIEPIVTELDSIEPIITEPDSIEPTLPPHPIKDPTTEPTNNENPQPLNEETNEITPAIDDPKEKPVDEPIREAPPRYDNPTNQDFSNEIDNQRQSAIPVSVHVKEIDPVTLDPTNPSKMVDLNQDS